MTETNQKDADQRVIGLRLPLPLFHRAEDYRKGRFGSISEYVRDLIRRDVEKSEKQNSDAK